MTERELDEIEVFALIRAIMDVTYGHDAAAIVVALRCLLCAAEVLMDQEEREQLRVIAAEVIQRICEPPVDLH
jgi:hypothetical protein